jgi:flagellar basal body-associated protein FliL
MESKKKKKIILSICIAAMVAIIAIVGIIFGVQNFGKKNSDSQNASNTSTITSTITLTNTYNEAIAEGRIPQNYNGSYKYLRIASIEFNFSEYSAEEQEKYIKKICENKGVRDVNGLINLLSQERASETEDEILVFLDGNYTKCKGENKIPVETGSYVGDDNLAQITIINPDSEGYFFISLNYKVPASAISPEASLTDSSNDGTKIYVFKNFVSKDNPDRILFTVTYTYQMIENNPTIPDNELDF